MIKTDKNKEKLLRKLKELFQLDQPDLDFGFYRIMQSRKEEITRFIDEELLGHVREAFESVDDDRLSHLKTALENELKSAKDYGVTEPEKSPKVIEARAKLEAAKNTGNIEADIYDHLFRFFERYYEGGDFISRRYYTRETDSKAAAYAIPYSGEEVMLHWANKDQYYVKSSDYFSNYRFNLNQAVKKHEVKPQTEQEELDFADSDLPAGLFVTFKIVDADEGDHGNIKTGEGDRRFFIIRESNPLSLISENELEIYFEYRSDPKKGSSQERTWREIKNNEAVDLIFAKLSDLPKAKHFLQGFETVLPTEKNKDRTLLEKYIYQYTGRNDRDFFIHKDLRGFLRRELDFYIKNEVMHLDDIEDATAPKAEEYLAKLKVIRKIAHKLIDFLAQLEDFQKKLWLKKKFVVDTNYCITLDRIPKALYPTICQNVAQREEWITLFAIDEIEGDALKEGYSEPLSVKFLEDNQSLVLDTKHFDESFKDELISSIDDFDEQCDGLLIHSENFQALGLLQERYREQVKCIYIDPPYNTGNDGFIYKDAYSSSSWLTMISERLDVGMRTLEPEGVMFASIGDEEQEHLSTLIRERFGKRSFFSTLIWEKKKKGSFLSGQIATMKDYIICVAKDIDMFSGLIGEITTEIETYPCVNASNPRDTRTIPSGIISNYREKDYHMDKGSIISAGNMSLVLLSDLIIKNGFLAQELKIEGNWRYSQESMQQYAIDGSLYITQDLYLRRTVNAPREKKLRDILFRLGENGDADYSLYDIDNLGKFGWGTNEDANNELHQIMGKQYAVSYPKPAKLILQLFASLKISDGYWIDYFAGSGTTGHAVINLNREDDGERKYILVEMGDYFNTVLKPRIQKVIYSKDWKDGKPENRETGISHCFKYIRLESYEDTLNNLSLVKDAEQCTIIESNRALKEDYMLNYFLDVESRDSLLNTDAFIEPMNYSMKIKKAGSDEQALQKIDLIETFNYLIGLRVIHIDKVQRLDADFLRERDPELPHDQKTKLILEGGIKETANGKWWIRKIEGWIPLNPYSPNDGQMEKVLIVWRNLSGNMEEDNLILDSWFERNRISPRDFEFDVIYVNGSNNLPNLRKEGESWKVRLIEEEFLKAMWASKA